MLLRMLRAPEGGGPSPLARLTALLLVIGLVGLSAPIIVVLARKLAALL
ncbi:hypothetical protein ACIB24_01920 [Spongisporangium articulatum]|uniref:Uncharacterized protein n=1 Tax=Spongisporangium articulatum TaxID=3362603 RepID=A0ABW8AHH9_9ACTN